MRVQSQCSAEYEIHILVMASRAIRYHEPSVESVPVGCRSRVTDGGQREEETDTKK